jgi:hypothetical protein
MLSTTVTRGPALPDEQVFLCPRASDILSRAFFWYNKGTVEGRSVSGDTSTATREHGRGSTCASYCEVDQSSAFLAVDCETLCPGLGNREDLGAVLRFNFGVFQGILWQPLMLS